ncbi:MAG: bifunctional [glutamate--ammonia ligase]-adenylyl-L-tyrosine phosphorylase/[glutamate--ammonia-ligase] adenylyltransferase [Gammaproteobacteria bacterium]
MDAIAALGERGRERLAELGLASESDPAEGFARAVGYSDFLYRLLARLEPDAAAGLIAAAGVPLTPGRIRTLVGSASDLAAVSERGLALIALREAARLMPTRASLLAASLLAETTLNQALAADPEAGVGFVIFGLGKLGGRELNFYSDLDLVFAGPPAADEREAERRLRAVRRLVARLEEFWRIDLRLRPFGQAGALVMGFPAMEDYFQNHGREWERYAWLKARAVAGARRSGGEFLLRLHPFIYRRYLDYHAIEALREMKRQIAAEAGASARDVKRGPGGIREIEFIVQVFQLVRGGREPALVGPRLRGALGAARRLDVLDARDVSVLRTAYDFLRQVENRLQIENRTPEHLLPEGEARRGRLAASLGHADWDAFMQELARHRDAVRRIFDAIFGMPAASAVRGPAERLWRGEAAEAENLVLAKELGFRFPKESVAALATFKTGRAVRLMGARARVALDRVAPELIAAAGKEEASDAALTRLLGLLQAIVRRSAYLALLAERPAARERLARLVGRSEWIARRLAASPVALDELLDPRTAAPIARGRLAREFASVLALADEPDFATERFREINEVARLKIAAGLADGSLSSGMAERYLSLLAERAVRTALALATERMRARHGALACELLAVGYGKLGSRELGFASDLDLVFVYECKAERAKDGLPAEAWLARLAQRTISLLSLPTALGALYVVDTRLRPEGTAGLLISRFDAWRRYQRGEARLWERQALLRARPVAGSARLARTFRSEQQDLLERPVESATLAREIVAMRARVAAVGPTRTAAAAALLDGEFLAAWWLLDAATFCPRVLRRCGFAAQLDALADCGTPHPTRELAQALATLRGEANFAVLGLEGGGGARGDACRWTSEQWKAASTGAAFPL